MVWQGFALLGQLVNQSRVVCFDELVEQCLLGLMALVGGFAKAMPINRGRPSLPCANMVVPPWRPGRPNKPACIGRPDNATSEVASEPVAMHPMR
jgi:hypothetical protein